MLPRRLMFPERRSGTRILTLKNTVWVLAGMLALFVIYSAYNEHRKPAGEPLYKRGAGAPATQDARPEVIEHRPVSDDTFATMPRSGLEGQPPSPMLGLPPAQPVAPPAAAGVTAQPARQPTQQPTLKETQQRGGRTVITQGADGVRVEVQPGQAAKPEITTTTPAPVPPQDF